MHRRDDQVKFESPVGSDGAMDRFHQTIVGATARNGDDAARHFRACTSHSKTSHAPSLSLR